MVVVAQEAVVVVAVGAALKAQLVTDQEVLHQLNHTEAGEAKWRILARFSGLSLNANNKKQQSQQYTGMCLGSGSIEQMLAIAKVHWQEYELSSGLPSACSCFSVSNDDRVTAASISFFFSSTGYIELLEMQHSTNTKTTRIAMAQSSVKLTDLSDQILLLIFSFIAATTEPEPIADVTPSEQDPSHQNHPASTFDSAPTEPQKPAAKKKNTQKKKKNRVAGLGARTLCRLCCCSQRLNHLASADQLWQELTLARFPDRHWPTTDQKNLDMIRVRREHQLKLLAPSTSSLNHQGSPAQEEEISDATDQQQDQESGDRDEEGQNKRQKRTKFYSRFEQRAHRRKFASLDPELRYTPLAWTNTFWTWKRTYFGNCRFVESKDVSTPNRIGR